MTGGCLRRAARLAVAGPLRDVVACPRRLRRRMSGDFGVAAVAARAAGTIDGAMIWDASGPEARCGLRGACGSGLPEGAGSGQLTIMAGSLGAFTGLALRGCIFVADKGAYDAAPDGLPQAAGAEPARSAP